MTSLRQICRADGGRRGAWREVDDVEKSPPLDQFGTL